MTYPKSDTTSMKVISFFIQDLREHKHKKKLLAYKENISLEAPLIN